MYRYILARIKCFHCEILLLVMDSSRVNVRNRSKKAPKCRMPELYRSAARVLERLYNKSGGLQDLVFGERYPQKKVLFDLIDGVRSHQEILDDLASCIKMGDEKFFLTRVLLYEIVIRDKFIDKPSIIVTEINKHKAELSRRLLETHKSCSKEVAVRRFPRFARVNTLKTTTEEVIALLKQDFQIVPLAPEISRKKFVKKLSKLEEHEFLEDPHIPHVLAFHPNVRFYGHPLYAKGHLLLQDKMSCVPSLLLNPQPGSVILDACAAPGMKTSHLAALIGNEGTILANDISEERLEEMNSILRDCGVTCVKTICEDFTAINPKDDIYSQVKYILADVPCTGSGMAKRLDVVEAEKQEVGERVGTISKVQKKILKHCLSFPNVERVVYTTCSVYKEENEEVVEEVMQVFGRRFKIVPSKLSRVFKRDKDTDPQRQFLGTYPDRDLCNGFFVAIFERIQPEMSEEPKQKKKKRRAKDE